MGEGLRECLRIPEGVYYGESPQVSLDAVVELWTGWFTQKDIWTESISRMFYNELMEYTIREMKELQLGYERSHQGYSGMTGAEGESSVPVYLPLNQRDLQYFIRLINFIHSFCLKIDTDYFEPWIQRVTEETITRIRELPRVSKLYSFLSLAMQIAEKRGVFREGALTGPIFSTYNILTNFFKELIRWQDQYEVYIYIYIYIYIG